jgi:hypothetical protein
MTKLNVTLAREILTFIAENKTTKEEFKESVKDLDTFRKLKGSIFNDYCTFEQFAKEETIEDNLYFYWEQEYVTTLEGNVAHPDNVNFCDFFEEYTEGDMFNVYIGSREYNYSRKAVRQEDLTEYCGEYYDQDALDRHNICYCEDDNDYHDRDNLYYWESDGCYHLEEEEDDSEEYVNGYHDGGYKTKTFSDKPQFFIGFEIEKEDKEVKESIYINDFKEELPLWRKERDGSLDDESGFELISPTYELDIKQIKKDIKKSNTLLNHINASKSKSCGGHINISEDGLTGYELFNNLKGYTPLFHALYYGRVDKNYSKGKSNEKLLSDNEKYQSIKIHSNRVEYRIISAVPNFETLMWRAELMEFILKNQTECTKDAFFKLNTTLLPLIKKTYNTPEKLNALIDRVIQYTLQFENVTLTREPIQA